MGPWDPNGPDPEPAVYPTQVSVRRYKKLNVATLSHGAMGAAKDCSWLAYPLAAKGWVVVGVNHFGESWRYGRQNIDPSSVTRVW